MNENEGIFILGEAWSIVEGTVKDFPMLSECDGYTDSSIRRIVVNNFEEEHDKNSKSDLDEYKMEVLRHEIIHAYLYESGLDCNAHTSDHWAEDEEIVDWIAIQAPKIFKTFIEAGAI